MPARRPTKSAAPKTPGRPRVAPASIGETPLARLLYAGRYGDIVASTIDAPRPGCAPADVAFVVGALSFVGRLEEARLFFEPHRRDARAPARTLCAGAFFLIVAYARAGDFTRAQATLTELWRATAGRRDAWSRAFLLQAIACCHYFGARYARAGKAALEAQGSALTARFAYVQMLATDMRAHVLAQRGEIDEGLRLLEQARSHALHLGFDVNVRVIETSMTLERARIQHPARAIEELERLLAATDIQDGYSRRLLLAEVSVRYALVGRGHEARLRLEEANRLGGQDARTQAALACTRAMVARVLEGWPAADRHLATAREALAVAPDPPLEVELRGLELGAATFLAKAKACRQAQQKLGALYAQHRLSRAATWLYVYGARDEITPRDEWAPLLRAVVVDARKGAASREGTRAVRRTGLWGLVAEASGLLPGRRIHLFEDAEVLEADGDVMRLQGLPPRGRAILQSLGQRALSKEALYLEVWGSGPYRPERHDSLVKTTLSRLRAALGSGAMWIETVEGGYRLATGIEVVAHGFTLITPASSLAEISRSPLPGSRGEAQADALDERAHRWSRLAELIERGQSLSVGELARELRATVRTVSRDLTAMHRQGLVERQGEGRGTKYRAPAPKQHR